MPDAIESVASPIVYLSSRQKPKIDPLNRLEYQNYLVSLALAKSRIRRVRQQLRRIGITLDQFAGIDDEPGQLDQHYEVARHLCEIGVPDSKLHQYTIDSDEWAAAFERVAKALDAIGNLLDWATVRCPSANPSGRRG